MAKKVWQITADAFRTKEEEEILRKRISLRRLPRQMDEAINRTILTSESLLSNKMLDPDQRASLASACSKLVTQYKFDLLCHHLQILQTIRRAYQKALTDALQELANCAWTDTVKQAIVDRQNKMVERHEVYLAHRLNTFFVEAPMV